MNRNNGSDDYDDYDEVAKAVAEKLFADMKREADSCGQMDVPASLDRRMEAMFASRRRKARLRHRIFSAGIAAAMVVLVSVCCLRQSMSPGDAGWSYEIGNKFYDTKSRTESSDDPTETDDEVNAAIDKSWFLRLLF